MTFRHLNRRSALVMLVLVPVLCGSVLCGSVLCGSVAGAAEPRYTLTPDDHGVVLVTPDGRAVFRYMTSKPPETKLTANSVCCLSPVHTPQGVRAVDFAPADHPHHRGIFLAWHAMTCGTARADFWGWGEWAPTQGRVLRNREARLTAADDQHAVLDVRNSWMIGDEPVVEEHSTITARQRDTAFVIDWQFQLTPNVDVKLDRTAFGGFCVKARRDGQPVYFGPEGKVELPDPHHLKPESNWPSKPWYGYVIELDEGKTIGVAVIDHPENPKSTWHNMEPIAMVNPCIVAPGELSISKGDTLQLRYRVVIHDGPSPTRLLEELAAQWP